MAEAIRTFIAIELTPQLQRALAETQARFKRDPSARSVRWVAPENIHVTLKFLGDVDQARMAELQEAIASVCLTTRPFAITLGSAGAFPNLRRPNVVWVGAHGQIDRVSQLAQEIDDACAELGFSREERPFTPHLTLGRVKREASPADRQQIGALIGKSPVGELGELQVGQVSVMKSELKPGGSVYTRLALCPFANEPATRG
jgi:RNA 2',3'-cyclic 3'-phosphodiesterase